MASDRQSAGIGKGTPGPGRRPGVPNRTTRAMREVFLLAFDELGGVSALVEWASRDDDNRGQFYGLLARLLPREVNLSAESGGFQLTIARAEPPAVEAEQVRRVVNLPFATNGEN